MRISSTESGEAPFASVVVTHLEPGAPSKRATAISEPSWSKIGLRRCFACETAVTLFAVEALIVDRLVRFSPAGFGAIAGYGWLKRRDDRAAGEI